MYSNGKVEKMRKDNKSNEYRQQDEKRNKPKTQRYNKRDQIFE